MILENFYSVIGALPFEWASFAFMQRAFVAIFLITPIFGLLSSMVVQSKMAFFSDSLGHGAFTGIAVGSLVGLLSPKVSLLVFSVIFALLVTYIKNKSKMEADTVIGVFSSAAIALGLAIMSVGGGFQKFANFLIGDLLAISVNEIYALFVFFIVVVLLWGKIFNKLLLSTVSPQIARSRKISSVLYEGIFASVLAVTVAMSIEWVGILLINSLLVLPAASARNVTNNIRSYSLTSVVFALLSGVIGLIGAYYMNTSAGAAIVLTGAVIFFVTLFMRTRFIK